MAKTTYVLHYPDGVVLNEIRNDVQPDAFLLKCPQGGAYWVSLKFSLNEVTEDEAKAVVQKVKIDNQSCDLMYIFPLWHLLQGLDLVNTFLRTLQVPELPYSRYWVKELNFAKSYKGLEWSGRTFCSFTDEHVKTALALPTLCIHDHTILRFRDSKEKPSPKADNLNVKSVAVPDDCKIHSDNRSLLR